MEDFTGKTVQKIACLLISLYTLKIQLQVMLFYTSKMNEICLHCHLLYFSSIILSFGQCAWCFKGWNKTTLGPKAFMEENGHYTSHRGGTYPLAHFLGNFQEKTKKVPTRTVSRKLPEISRKFSKKLTALLPLAHF